MIAETQFVNAPRKNPFETIEIEKIPTIELTITSAGEWKTAASTIVATKNVAE